MRHFVGAVLVISLGSFLLVSCSNPFQSDGDGEELEDAVWESSGHEPKVFDELFSNPDYSDHEALQQEDGLTERTDQVTEVADLINDEKDLSTIKEIQNLLYSIRTPEQSPENTFEVSAAQILTTPVTGGCTTFATAFATLARAKGIPAVVVDSARLKWIKEGSRIDTMVYGHFWVEVYIEDEWHLVDSTAGVLYENYDRSNWFLPEGRYSGYRYVAFSKSLSVIDTGATEESHNLLQRVAFVKKDVDYIDPDYPEVDLRDDDLEEDMKADYEALDLDANDEFSIDTSGTVFTIEASSAPEDLQNISS
ncbi:MAG: transglutaminase domain-containing protein [Spirochaetia bacterium]